MAGKRSVNSKKTIVDGKPRNGVERKPTRRKRRFDPTEKLPTPPPDPHESMPKRKSVGLVEPGAEDAFAHLDKLHSLVEQILDLRDKNARLFRRVRELERFKALRKLDTLGSVESHGSLPDEDLGFAESLLRAILPPQEEPVTRPRSRSIDGKPVFLPKRSTGQYVGRSKRNSLIGSTLGVGSPKVSKWTKVKAAFKWEKAGLGTSSALSNVVVEALEHADPKFLRLPESVDTTSPSGSSPRTTELSGPPSPGTISSSSSTDDVYNGMQKRVHAARATKREIEEDPSRRSRSLDGELVIPHNIQYASQNLRDGCSGSSRRLVERGLIKTPWGMVKDIITSRRGENHVRRALPRNSIRSDDGYSISSHESSDMINEILIPEQSPKPRVQIVTSHSEPSGLTVPATSSPVSSSRGEEEEEVVTDLASRRLTPTLTITVPSSEELRSVSSPESASPQHLDSQQHLDSNSTDERSPSDEPDFRESRKSGSASAPKPLLQRQNSKWNKVKKAFLTSAAAASSVPPSPSRNSSFFDETDVGGSYSASAEDLENNNSGVSPVPLSSDIERNYQLLHDKLSSEFNRKLAEWERLRSHRSTATSPKDKDSANALLMGEEQLTPEFKKKLQEWKRIKKSGPSAPVSPDTQVLRRRLTDWQLWRTPGKTDGGCKGAGESDNVTGKANLSEEFLKKMEEWKKIKSGRSDEEQQSASRRDSADLPTETIYLQGRGSCSGSSKPDRKWAFDEREFQPLDRIVALLEREQERVGRHREKLDKSLRIDQLVDSIPAKREVLVHTSTGFYRFEGISQEFTRKLYEWEKSQGIAPESSTLRLLSPSYSGSGSGSGDRTAELARDKSQRSSIKRSKSMGSVVVENRDATPIRQPSSLSLNDVTNLENQAKSRIDSKQTIGEEETSEELALALDDYSDEPEAVIVDVEDVVEETASPMTKYQPQQTPVYCVTASETTSIAVPLGTVTACSHQPSLPTVVFLEANLADLADDNLLHRVENHLQYSQLIDEDMVQSSSYESSSESSHSKTHIITFEGSGVPTDDNRKRLFEPSDISICETIIEEEVSSSQIGEESSSDAEIPPSVVPENDVPPAIEPYGKTEEEADETSSPSFGAQEKEDEKPSTSKQKVVLENGDTKEDEESSVLSDASKSSEDVEKIVFRTLLPRKSITPEGDDNEKETIEEAKKDLVRTIPNHMSEDREVNDAVITVNSDVRQKRVLKTRRLTDTQVGYKWRQPSETIEEKSPEPSDALTVSTFPETPSVERIIINESTLNKIVVPTASNEQLADTSKTSVTEERRLAKSESKSVFVKTKRIIFSPFSRRNSKDKNPPAQPEVVPAAPPPVESPSQSPVLLPSIRKSRSSTECPVAFERRPPLPQSPILSRKEYRRSSPKETAPSIRMMIQRYNQKLQEDAGSPASSGSGSPIWRSPTSERRVRNQMEKYQEEVRRAIAGSTAKYDVQKSASAGVIPSRARNHEILKSTSVDFAKDFKPEPKVENGVRRNSLQNKNPEIFSNIKQSLAQEFKTLPIKSDRASDTFGKISPELIHKLNALSIAAGSCSENSTPLRIRAQRIKKAKDDFFSRSSGCHSHDPSVDRFSQDGDSFVKSASAGMINRAESESRPSEKIEISGTLSKIASKFRRAKMKRAKDRDSKMRTVSMLCRQSLLVDIQVAEEMSKSCPTSPSVHHREDDEHCSTRFKHHRDA